MVYFNSFKKTWFLTIWDYFIFYMLLNVFLIQIVTKIKSKLTNKSASKISNSSFETFKGQPSKKFIFQNQKYPEFNWTAAWNLLDSIEFKFLYEKLNCLKIYFIALESQFFISRNLVFRLQDFNLFVTNFIRYDKTASKSNHFKLIETLRAGDLATTPTSSPAIIDVDTAVKLVLRNFLILFIQFIFSYALAAYVGPNPLDKGANAILEGGKWAIAFVAKRTLEVVSLLAALIFGPDQVNSLTLLITMTGATGGTAILWYYVPSLFVLSFRNVARILVLSGVASAYVTIGQQSYERFLVYFNKNFPLFLKFLEKFFVKLAASVAARSLDTESVHINLIGDFVRQAPERLKKFGMNYFQQDFLPSDFYMQYITPKPSNSSKKIVLNNSSSIENSYKIINETPGWTEHFNSLNSADPNLNAQCELNEMLETLESVDLPAQNPTDQNVDINAKTDDGSVYSSVPNTKIKKE